MRRYRAESHLALQQSDGAGDSAERIIGQTEVEDGRLTTLPRTSRSQTRRRWWVAPSRLECGRSSKIEYTGRNDNYWPTIGP